MALLDDLDSAEKDEPTGVVRVDSWKIVCQECRDQYEDYNGWSIFGEQWHAIESAEDNDWTVRDGLVLCGSCGHRKVCMDEDRACTRRDLSEADDGWMYCPDHIEQGMDAPSLPPAEPPE
jgi:hypothetical protein